MRNEPRTSCVGKHIHMVTHPRLTIGADQPWRDAPSNLENGRLPAFLPGSSEQRARQFHGLMVCLLPLRVLDGGPTPRSHRRLSSSNFQPRVQNGRANLNWSGLPGRTNASRRGTSAAPSQRKGFRGVLWPRGLGAGMLTEFRLGPRRLKSDVGVLPSDCCTVC